MNIPDVGYAEPNRKALYPSRPSSMATCDVASNVRQALRTAGRDRGAGGGGDAHAAHAAWGPAWLILVHFSAQPKPLFR